MTDKISTEGVAGGIDTLFRSLYTFFFLRDVMGKMVPGGIALLVAGYFCLSKELILVTGHSCLSKELIAAASKGSWAAWILAATTAWLTGLGLQGFGEAIGLFPRAPRETTLELWEYRRVSFRKLAGEPLQQDFERLVVIKEASGTGCVSLALSLAIAIAHALGGESVCRWALLLTALAVVVGLYKMHHGTFAQAFTYMNIAIINSASR